MSPVIAVVAVIVLALVVIACSKVVERWANEAEDDGAIKRGYGNARPNVPTEDSAECAELYSQSDGRFHD